MFYGANAESLYTQEINALYALRATGRFSEVVCDSSRAADRFWSNDFTGPYFIAKPTYRTSLESVLSVATDFEKIDLAAQEVLLAYEMLGADWRDWDWNVKNDIVEDGKIIRIDLDSATSLNTLLKDKGNINDSRYFSTEDKDTIKEFLLSREKITTNAEASEVRNMAIRLSYLLLPRNEHQRLADQISQIQTPTDRRGSAVEASVPGGAKWSPEKRSRIRAAWSHAQRVLSHFIQGNDGLNDSSTLGLSGRSSDDDHGTISASSDPELSRKWLDLWCGRTAAATQENYRLTADEWRVVALTLYHLIAESEHGFDLQDLYKILLETNARYLRNRLRKADVNDVCRIIDTLSPNIKFSELRRYMRAQAVVHSLPEVEETPRRKEDERAKPLPLRVEAASGQGAWKATIKPLGRECEDRVLCLEHENLIVVALTDGVSEAEGERASAIVIEQVQSLFDSLKGNSLTDITPQLRDLLNKTNVLLGQARKDTNKKHQATLVLAVVIWDRYECRAWIAQAGDSDCVILLADGSIRPGASTFNWATKLLGRQESVTQGDFRVESFRLDTDNSERYRIRVFSDGTGERAFERIKQFQEVGDLVRDAASWDKSLGVGADDWSIAGADLSLQRVPVIARAHSANVDASSQTPKGITAEQAELIPLINRPVEIIYSTAATKFLRAVSEEPTDNKNTREESASLDPVIIPTGPSAELPLRTNGVRVKTLVVLSLVLVAVSSLMGLSIIAARWYFSEGSGSDRQIQSTEQAPDTRKEPTFSRELQKQLFSGLASDKHAFVKFGLSGGEGMTPDVKIFIDDVAEVVKQGQLRITLEIYSTPAGGVDDNLKTTNQRRDTIREYLGKGYGLKEDQVNVISKGSWKQFSATDNELLPPTAEQNKALIRVLLKP